MHRISKNSCMTFYIFDTIMFTIFLLSLISFWLRVHAIVSKMNLVDMVFIKIVEYNRTKKTLVDYGLPQINTDLPSCEM